MIHKNLISRYNIHPEIKLNFWRPDINKYQIHTYNDLIESIRHWKNILAEQEDMAPGKKVGLAISYIDLRYTSCLFAVSELGGVIPIMDTVPLHSKTKPRCRVLAPFDLYVYSNNIPQEAVNVGKWYAKKQLDFNCWFDYTSTTNHQYADVILAQEDDVIIVSPTSGSTEEPKKITYSHKWLSAVGDHCTQTFNFSADDRILHLSNLHHGGSSGCFFFPTVKHCKEHYFEHGMSLDPEDFERIIKLIVDKKINRVMFPTSHILDQVLRALPPLEHKCYFYTLQANLKSWISEVKRINLAGIFSIFGASEMLGPIFLNTITPATTDSHDVLNYGKPLTNFYSVEIQDQQLYVSDKTGRNSLISDRFEIDSNGDYHYKSRSSLIRVNEVTFEFGDLERILVENFDALSAVLIADSVSNKIYLLIDLSQQDTADIPAKINNINLDLSNINKILKIGYVDYQPIKSFISGIKVNRSLVTEHFRKKFNLT